MKIAVVGKTGEVEERIAIGPSCLTRRRLWNEAAKLVALFERAGAEAFATHPLDNAGPDPDLWLLADAPRAALVSSGLRARIAAAVRLSHARLFMLGGCFSLGGQGGAGGWHDDPMLPATSEGDDTVECVRGVVATGPDPEKLSTWTSWGYNRVAPRAGARVEARFGEDPALIRSADGRVGIWCSDLLPHWGPGQGEVEAVATWLRRNVVEWGAAT
jgi:hypothetical protein